MLSVDAASMTMLSGIVAAGYAGTDFIEAFAPGITTRMVPGSPALAKVPALARLPMAAQSAATSTTLRVVEGTVFGSLVPNGYFSADPYNENIPRSIRANNPGALNYTEWQQSRPGFAGTTAPDNSPKANVTTIYRTPEHGVAAWYHLLAARYDFPGGTFSLNELAVRYAGSSNAQTIAAYIRGWTHWLNPAIPPSKPISLSDDKVMLQLAKAMFSHEAGIMTPLGDDQITFAIGHERDGTLPP